jgi:uncharacterized protein YodC (DUF2158 family)
MPNFQPGDVVRHKSSGQQMVVIEVMKNGTIHCSYQDADKKFQQGFFAADILEKSKKSNNSQNKYFRFLLIVVFILILFIIWGLFLR